MGIDFGRSDCTIASILDHTTPASDPTVDMSSVSWCDVSGLVGLASVVDRARRRGRRVVVVAPKNRSVANYLAVMRLGEVLDELGAHHDLPSVRSHGAETILPLQRFGGAADASHLATHVFDTVYPVDSDVAAALYTGLCEAGENVEDHSGQGGGYVAAQRYDRDGRFWFAVGDSGYGMRRTLGLSRHEAHETAIRSALQDGVTGSGDAGRGNGLPDIARSIGKLRGNLLIASGDASVIRRRRPGEVTARTHVGRLGGTVLRGLVPTGRTTS